MSNKRPGAKAMKGWGYALVNGRLQLTDYFTAS
ncbi:MAG: hypothetical protein H6Q33_4548 [Deltaproteobacteria bacterium]|jgi:hypothetical protein|nr:hypothetical protein [Deltaproteobacteria bacterium]